MFCSELFYSEFRVTKNCATIVDAQYCSGTPELIACSFTVPPPQVDWIVHIAVTVCVSGYVHSVGRTARIWGPDSGPGVARQSSCCPARPASS